MSEILQGTTPSLEIIISKTDFLVSDITKLEFTIRHNGIVSIHDLSEVTLDAERNSVAYLFTEIETLAMNPKQPIEYQLRFMFADSHIVGTKSRMIEIADLISKDVMSG